MAEQPQFKPIRKNRIADEVVVQLTHHIIEGVYRPGDQLPPERELAARFAINRTSLREALRRLETLGLLQVRPGDGVFVQDHRTHSGLEFVKYLLESGIGLDKKMILDVAEIRRTFTVQMLELAAERRTAESLEALRVIVDRYPYQDAAARRNGELDFAFWREIAKATGNMVFIYLLNTIQEVVLKMSGLYFQLEADPQLAADLYRRLLKALRRGNKKQAAAVFMKRALDDDRRLAATLEDMK